MIALSCIGPSLPADRVEAIVAEASGGRLPLDLREIFYPYYWFLFRATVRTLFGESSTRISCLVDARTRSGATSDPFDLSPRWAPSRDVLDRGVEEGEAAALATRIVSHVRPPKRRSLVSTRRELLRSSLAYKPFWVGKGEDGLLLVDGVTGGAHPLAI